MRQIANLPNKGSYILKMGMIKPIQRNGIQSDTQLSMFLYVSLMWSSSRLQVTSLSFQSPRARAQMETHILKYLKSIKQLTKFKYFLSSYLGFPGGIRNRESTCQFRRHETWVQSLGLEDSLEEEVVTHSSILAWRIPRTEESGRLQSIGLQRVRHD